MVVKVRRHTAPGWFHCANSLFLIPSSAPASSEMVPRSPLPDNHAIDSLVSSISLKSPQEGANRYRSTSEASNTTQKTPLDNIRSIWRKHQAYAKLGKQITDHKTIAETPTTTTIVECTPCLNNPPTSSGILS